MRVALILAALVLMIAVFGIAGFFGYQLYVKPSQIEKAEKAESPAARTPPPDYSLPAFEKAAAQAKAGKLFEARDELENFINQYPQSTKLAEAKRLLGNLNTGMVFSASDAPGKKIYTVGKGDSLVKIATREKSNAELIFRANNLESINLKIGQQLRIPRLDISVVVDRKANTLTLLDQGRFFKDYAILSLKIPSIRGQAPVEAKVADKVALKGSERVAFGSKEYLGSERWIMLSAGGAILRGAPASSGDSASAPPGIVVSQEDIEEIFPLVTRGNSVTFR